jgi:hypothetical protein
MSAGGAAKYRLDFTEFKEGRELKDDEEEVVLSLKRLERVFGKLVLPEPQYSPLQGWLRRRLGRAPK